MKAIILMFFMLVAINSNATNNPNKESETEATKEAKKELSKKMHFDLQNFDLQDNRAFVKASFKVNADHSITVLQSNYSNPELKDEVLKQLKEIKLENVEVGKVYECKLMFEIQ